jgi:Trk K+ transport system NAD-binding subunit
MGARARVLERVFVLGGKQVGIQVAEKLEEQGVNEAVRER